MSVTPADLADLAADCLTDTCWRQWTSLQGDHRLVDGPVARAVIDPEALVLASLAMSGHEARLRDRVNWWLEHGVQLLSVQRLNTLRRLHPSDLKDEVSWLARRAVQLGDARWKRLEAAGSRSLQAGEQVDSEPPVRAGKGPRRLTLLSPTTIVLRLRAGFGVGAKADLLAFLICISSEIAPDDELFVTGTTIDDIIGYSRTSVKRAITDMLLARLIEASGDRPVSYSLDHAAWCRLLQLHELTRDPFRVAETEEPPVAPPWRHWSHVFALLAACDAWGREATTNALPAVVAASRARDLVDAHRPTASRNRWPLPNPDLHPGESFLEPFGAFVRHVVTWVREHV